MSHTSVACDRAIFRGSGLIAELKMSQNFRLPPGDLFGVNIQILCLRNEIGQSLDPTGFQSILILICRVYPLADYQTLKGFGRFPDSIRRDNLLTEIPPTVIWYSCDLDN